MKAIIVILSLLAFALCDDTTINFHFKDLIPATPCCANGGSSSGSGSGSGNTQKSIKLAIGDFISDDFQSGYQVLTTGLVVEAWTAPAHQGNSATIIGRQGGQGINIPPTFNIDHYYIDDNGNIVDFNCYYPTDTAPTGPCQVVGGSGKYSLAEGDGNYLYFIGNVSNPNDDYWVYHLNVLY